MQDPGPTSTAEPPEVPPILPLVKPVAASNVAETFASSAVFDSCARPTARPATEPLSYTAEKSPRVSLPDASTRNEPETVPTLSVELTTLRTRSVIGPVRSASPAAVPVYLPSVTTTVFESDVVHD